MAQDAPQKDDRERGATGGLLEAALAGLALDLLDLLTVGPIGLWAGMIVGGAAGWWLAPRFGFRSDRRWICALLAGVYCTVPATSFLPVASVLTVASRLVGGKFDDKPREPHEGKVIEVDFSANKAKSGDDRDDR